MAKMLDELYERRESAPRDGESEATPPATSTPSLRPGCSRGCYSAADRPEDSGART
jgi:hypothetical protein